MEELEKLNEELKKRGMLPLMLINPVKLKPQKKNARYFKPEKFSCLTKNIRSAGNLESVPLVVTEGDETFIISGHHRVDASKEAGLKEILCMVASVDPADTDEIKSKQLAHNALVGEDDQAMLAELFKSIKEIEARIATGLQDEIKKIEYQSLNFKIGTYKEFSILFLPEDKLLFEDALNELIETVTMPPKKTAHIASMGIFDKFAESIMEIKKTENIKNNAVALLRLTELAFEYIEILKAQKEAIDAN